MTTYPADTVSRPYRNKKKEKQTQTSEREREKEEKEKSKSRASLSTEGRNVSGAEASQGLGMKGSKLLTRQDHAPAPHFQKRTGLMSRSTDIDTDRLHAEMVRVVAESVAGLLPKFGPQGLTIEALIEGAAKGTAMATMAATGATLAEVGDIFEELADGMRANVPDNDNGNLLRRH
jgi:hypothetical protein